jgi:hypothetical protein
MKIEIGCMAMIRFGETDDEFERDIISQSVGKFVRISATALSDSGTCVVWAFEDPIPVSTSYGFAALCGVTEKFLIPVAPPGLTEDTTVEKTLEAV